MGYEVVWEPKTDTWAIWSTVSCGYIERKLPSPDSVAASILSPNSFYYLKDKAGRVREESGRKLIATAEFTSRESIASYYLRLIENAQDSCWNEFENGRWERKCTTKEQVKRNLELGKQATLQQWDRGDLYPDPEAKAELMQDWIEEAKRVRAEGRVAVKTTVCELAPEGLKYKEEHVRLPESLV